MGHDRGRTALRALLEEGPSDKRVVQQRALIAEMEAALAEGNTAQQNEIAMKLAALAKEIRAAEDEQRAAMSAAVDRALSLTDEATRAAKLVEAFEICALTEVVAHDDFDDDETVARAIEHKHAIAAALDAMPGGRAALETLLDSPFAGVRASAGAHLLNAGLLRERIVPILQEIERRLMSSAGWTAFWALSPDDHGAWLDPDGARENKK